MDLSNLKLVLGSTFLLGDDLVYYRKLLLSMRKLLDIILCIFSCWCWFRRHWPVRIILQKITKNYLRLRYTQLEVFPRMTHAGEMMIPHAAVSQRMQKSYLQALQDGLMHRH